VNKQAGGLPASIDINDDDHHHCQVS